MCSWDYDFLYYLNILCHWTELKSFWVFVSYVINYLWYPYKIRNDKFKFSCSGIRISFGSLKIVGELLLSRSIFITFYCIVLLFNYDFSHHWCHAVSLVSSYWLNIFCSIISSFMFLIWKLYYGYFNLFLFRHLYIWSHFLIYLQYYFYPSSQIYVSSLLQISFHYC